VILDDFALGVLVGMSYATAVGIWTFGTYLKRLRRGEGP